MAVVGVDGCGAGWFAIRIEDGGAGPYELGVFGEIAELVDAWDDAALILIDVPIGLPDDGTPRACDVEARKKLGRGRRSPPAPPCRAALDIRLRELGPEEASGAGRERTGTRPAPRASRSDRRIAEVDRLMRGRDANSRPAIRETHPEICFWALNGERPADHRKGCEAGRRERFDILSRHYPSTINLYDEARARFRRRAVADDDILDAAAAALTAVPADRGADLRALSDGRADAFGLPMEIVYTRDPALPPKPSIHRLSRIVEGGGAEPPAPVTPIVRNFEILGGAPVFAGTRVPVSILTEYLEAGDPLAEFLADYPSVSKDQLVEALELAREIIDGVLDEAAAR